MPQRWQLTQGTGQSYSRRMSPTVTGPLGRETLVLVRLLLLVCFLSTPALAGPPRDGARNARMSRPAPPSEAGHHHPSRRSWRWLRRPDAPGVDAAGALGMLTALAASFVFARGRKTR